MAFSNPRRRASATPSGQTTVDTATVLTSTALRKGATFHCSSSRCYDSDTFTPPRLPRSQSHLDDVVDANRRRVALTLTEIDEALAMTEHLSLSPKKSSNFRDTSIPVPRGFFDGSAGGRNNQTKEQEKRASRPRSARRAHCYASDSGIGSSLASSNELGSDKKNSDRVATSTIKRPVAASNTEVTQTLSTKSISRISEYTLKPLLRPEFVDFKSLVLDIPRRIRSKEIICLRDVEKTLTFIAHDKVKSAATLVDFSLTSIRCIQATVEYISDREQVRPGDLPYSNGYFIDLKDQLLEYGKQLALQQHGDVAGVEKLDPADEVRLIGGIAENGRPAELVRLRKDGTAISMATGEVVSLHEGPVQVKRSLSEVREDEEEIMRSMARRKKNASPEELAPKQCREPGCNKSFSRPCDLTKHEKTHSRPWKCPIPSCKYHNFGWPTEKEMERHRNDKHSAAPAMFECHFKPCPYKSKRESNCKQHMEKAHGWEYVRTKTNGTKKTPVKTDSSVQQTPPLANASTPSDAFSVPTPPQDAGQMSSNGEFPAYPADADWLAAYGCQPTTLDNMDISLEHLSPSSAGSYENFPPYQNGSQFITDEDIYAATVHMPTHNLTPEMMMYGKMMPQQTSLHFGQPLPQPQLQQQHHQQQHQQQLPLPPAPEYGQPFPAIQTTNSAQFSPNAQQNAMLYTPPSMDEVDEGMGDGFQGDDADFQLFPGAMSKQSVAQPLFGEMPSTDMGLSQATQPEIFHQLDFSQFSYTTFQE